MKPSPPKTELPTSSQLHGAASAGSLKKITPDQVSCVVPYAGAVKYISETVGSAVVQGFGEVIIVNDGCESKQLSDVAGIRGVRIIQVTKSVGCPQARNTGIKSCRTPYVVLLDHDDILCDGYFQAMSSWILDNQLRCAAASLRYIGESARRVGRVVSHDVNFVLPSGFFSEVGLIAEVGYFPDCYSDDLLFFRAVRQATQLTTCPAAGVLYRIHPQAESSRNTKAWWAFNQLLPFFERGSHTLAELNHIAQDYAQNGTIPRGMELVLCGSEAAAFRLLSRSAYASWLNRDLIGVAKCSAKLMRFLPESYRLVRLKWRKRGR
jgi:glycosyltransferase involved in cell wall biosynthesis